MQISEVLKKQDRGVSFEFFPPKTDKAMDSLGVSITALKKYKPLYVSMTYGASGSTQGATKEATYMLLKEKDLVVMPHLTCIGASRGSIKTLLDEYRQKGIENIMALRGDPPKDLPNFNFKNQELCYAKNLVSLIKNYGHFCIGIALYPEGHIETSSLAEDIEYAKQKIDAGASFGVTQMFFDNAYYYRMLERMKKRGIDIAVLPGIFPLTDINKLKKFCAVARTTIPKHIAESMSRFVNSPQEMQKLGIDFTIAQCRDLINNGHKRLHFFTFNKPQIIQDILDALK
jgi:methylenetetrahydrofolate reductase (NADPH)